MYSKLGHNVSDCLVVHSEFDRGDLASHLDLTHSQLNGLREMLTGSSPQINIDPNLMLDVRATGSQLLVDTSVIIASWWS